MNIVKYRKIFYWFSGLIILISVFVMFAWGLNLGTDFKGGTIIEISYEKITEENNSASKIKDKLSKGGFEGFSVRQAGDNGYILKFSEVSDSVHQDILQTLSIPDNSLTEERFSSIGPVLGSESLKKSVTSVALVIIAIILFIAFVFRKVSEPVSSWKYGFIAIFALAHDVILPLATFSVLGKFLGYEVDTLFVTAVLVVLGFSVHDTIVVFDRVRENLRLSKEFNLKKDFETIVGESINQTLVRSLNTSLTTIIALFCLYFLGGEITKNFSLVLIIGIVAGTYSSIFLASPMLVTFQKLSSKN